MSNLSELLPAGSSVKSADFVAQGTLASGVTVGLRSDGKVEAISGVTQVIGSGSAYFQASSSNNYAESAYDTANDKVVVVYRAGGNNDYGSAVVGTVSGNTISWGTPVVFSSSSTRYTSIAFDSSNNKSVIAYAPLGDSSRGTAIVGTVSGTSISFGSPTVFDSGFNMEGSSCVFDTSNNKVVIAYDYGNGPAGKAIVGTVSGTGISFGSATTFMTVNPTYIDATFDSNSNKVVVTYKNSGSNQYLYVIVGTVSGTSISFGTPVVMSSANNFVVKITFDSVANKVIGVYGTGGLGDVVVGTVSGTSISFGTPVPVIPASATGINQAAYGVTFDPIANKVVILFQDGSNSPYSTYLSVGTVSGTSISMEAPVLVSNQNNNELSAVYDPDSNKVVGVWRFGTTGGQGAVITIGSTNATSFVGITDQAISSAATGKVVCKGGAITNTGLLSTFSSTFNTAVEVAGDGRAGNILYDPTNNKVIALYSDGDNSNYGTAKVGTVSGTSTSWGSATVFESATANQIHCVYDVNAQRVVVVYQDAGNSSYPTVVIGTVAGTGISFGSPVVALSGSGNIQVTYDAGQQKCLVAYNNFSAGSIFLMVGTVSGTSISFGSPLSVSSTTTGGINGIVYDANAAKSVLFWGTGSNAEAVVATISGTSVSVGSTVQYSSGTNLQKGSAVYDSVAQKVVTVAKNSNNEDSTANVGTVSGTSISFGTEVIADSTVNQNGESAIVYDVAQNKILHVFGANAGKMYSQVGTVSGTTTTWSTAVEIATANYHYVWGLAYNSSTTSNVLLYSDSGRAYILEAQVATIAQDTLTPNTAYFVQDDGTISTTSSTTKAGTALSTTSLLLTG